MHADALKKFPQIRLKTLRILKRIPRHLWQLPYVIYLNFSHSKTSLFVVGCQRSGTTMLLNVLERCPQCRVFQEGNRRIFNNYRLREYDTIQRIISRSPQRVVVFKPLNDLQHTNRLIEVYPNAKAIWIFRQYNDVVSSAVEKWGAVQKDIIDGIAKGYQKHIGQSTIEESVSPEVLEFLRRLCTDKMSFYDGAAVLWYVQNSKFFSQKLHDNRQVLLAKYEDLVMNPEEHFKRLFNFIGCRFDSQYVNNIYTSSLGKPSLVTINPEIESYCEEMMDRLNRVYGS